MFSYQKTSNYVYKIERNWILFQIYLILIMCTFRHYQKYFLATSENFENFVIIEMISISILSIIENDCHRGVSLWNALKL